MLQELIQAFTLIFIAEMGDKTQILAMAFATRYPVKKVLAGIFLGAFFNHGLAVLLGSYISTFIPIDTIQIAAGFAFVGFALWTLKPEGDDDEEVEEKASYGPVLTVALAFFIGELGDKTQLTAITLAADAAYPFFILCGTVLGMIVTGGLGIFVGRKLGNRIPEFTIKIIAATVFMFFGVTKLLQNLPARFITGTNAVLFFGVITALVYVLIRSTLEKKKQGRESLLARKSQELRQYYLRMEQRVDRICLGEGLCGSCQGEGCQIGYIKALIRKGLLQDEDAQPLQFPIHDQAVKKEFDRADVMKVWQETLMMVKDDPTNPAYERIHSIRRLLEEILFGESIQPMDSWEEYWTRLQFLDRDTADRVISNLDQSTKEPDEVNP